MNLHFGNAAAGEDDEQPIIPQAHTDFITFLQNYLKQTYVPVQFYKDATFTKTTKEIFEALQLVYPSMLYSVEEVATWMFDAGFKIEDVGVMRYEWLMKENG